MPVSLLIDEIARDLDQHENALRIRKLLFCACHQRWEGDRDVLQQMNLAVLIEQLHRNNPTLDQCTETLFNVVNHLNRKTEYTQVANLIIATVGQLYQDQTEATVFFPKTEVTRFTPPPQTEDTITEIIQALNQHPEALRIRKLIYCACYNHWENEVESLMNLDLTQALTDLQANHPHIDDLSLTLQVIVMTLNRKVEYASVANFILSQMGLLYPEPDAKQTLIRYLPQPPQPQTPLPVHEVTAPVEETPSEAVAPEMTEDSPSEVTDYALTGSAPSQPPGKPESERAASPPELPAYDSFKVRLEVMKYANPLRVKMLAYSVLNQVFDGSSGDWSNLRSQTLDYLLVNLYHRYSTFSELSVQLYNTANHLSDPTENAQAAEAILQAIKPYYPS